MSENVITLTDATFEQTIKESDIPILVDFWADWCQPCRAVAPILDEIAQEYPDKIKIAKLDIEANQNTPLKFGIRSIPTMLVFNNGEIDKTILGSKSKETLVQELEL